MPWIWLSTFCGLRIYLVKEADLYLSETQATVSDKPDCYHKWADAIDGKVFDYSGQFSECGIRV